MDNETLKNYLKNLNSLKEVGKSSIYATLGKWLILELLVIHSIIENVTASQGTGTYDKTELLWAGSKYGSALLGSSGPSLQLEAETIKASDHVRLLGVTISSDLSLDKHVSTIVFLYCIVYKFFKVA